MPAPFVEYVTLNPQAAIDGGRFPGSLPFVAGLRLEFDCPVTLFVGENGSGKSTLLEAIAVLAGLPATGGGTNELDAGHGPAEETPLADLLRLAFTKRPRDGYFFRAELQAHFASLLDRRKNDPDFADPKKDAFRRYGGASLHAMSHGEAFLAVMQHRFSEGLFLLDEPESALSPQRQLALLALMDDLVHGGKSQFIIATHSPILMTYPGAKIINFDDTRLPSIAAADTAHHQITRGILNHPESYWKHLRTND